MDSHTLAYLAGAMDSDGFFGIKRSTYQMRVTGNAHQPVFQERMGLKQTTPQVPYLLKEAFGGMLRTDRPATPNSKPMWNWQASDKIAATATAELRPYLRIKTRQAELILELRGTKISKFWQISYWFEQKNPEWRKLPMATFPEAAAMLGYKDVGMVPQAVHNKTLLALPWENNGRIVPRIPISLIEAVIADSKRSKDGRARCRPLELITWRQRLCDECRELNRIGTGLHPISERTGVYAPL